MFVKNRLETSCTSRRQRECRQTNGLLSATMCQHSHYALLYTFRSRPLQIKILRSTFSVNCCCIQFRTAHICSMFRKGNFSVIPTSTLNRGNCGIPKFRNRIEIHLPKGMALAAAVVYCISIKDVFMLPTCIFNDTQKNKDNWNCKLTKICMFFITVCDNQKLFFKSVPNYIHISHDQSHQVIQSIRCKFKNILHRFHSQIAKEYKNSNVRPQFQN